METNLDWIKRQLQSLIKDKEMVDVLMDVISETIKEAVLTERIAQLEVALADKKANSKVIQDLIAEVHGA